MSSASATNDVMAHGAATIDAARDVATTPRIDLARPGPTEQEWLRVIDALPALGLDDLAGRRVVVVAPHPDDESLGIGGTVAMLAAAGAPVTFVCVTDGEAAPTPLARLDRVRRAELDQAVRRLVPAPRVVRYGLPDGRLSMCANELEARLSAEIGRGDLVFATLDGDGHPDHDAVGAAARSVACAVGAELWWYPVWAWHWHDPATSPIATQGRRIDLTPAAMDAKRTAISCHRSQLFGVEPVVPRGHLPRFGRSCEVVIRG
jgi:LmbE family N-acetylglucosaminyl deacetylase